MDVGIIGELLRAQMGCIRSVSLAEEGGKNVLLWSERVELPLQSQRGRTTTPQASDPMREVLLEDPEGDER